MKKSRLLGAVCACLSTLVSISAHAVGVSGQGTWETTLQARDFDANPATIEGYYDTVLGITWLADASANGLMTWDAANTWAADLSFGPGIDAWRLPTMIDNGNDGCNFADTGTDCGYNVQTTSSSPPYPATTVYSEMASMFYDTLGNLAYFDTSGTGPQPGWGLSNTGPFDTLQSDYYWSGLEYAPDTSNAWFFDFLIGVQNLNLKNFNYYAWAVHSGDVGAIVPVPAAVWLFGSGLLALAGLGKQRRR